MKDNQVQPKQIVCLEHQNRLLYAEVIDIIEARQMCWGRPIMLVNDDLANLYDLREGSDILLPVTLFRPALDTEIIPFLVKLQSQEISVQANSTIAHQELRSFVQQVWQDKLYH